jgi:hypothetical protein
VGIRSFYCPHWDRRRWYPLDYVLLDLIALVHSIDHEYSIGNLDDCNDYIGIE